MKYNEFVERLRELKAEFASSEGREPKTLEEFEAYLLKRRTGAVRPRALRSLKGLDV